MGVSGSGDGRLQHNFVFGLFMAAKNALIQSWIEIDGPRSIEDSSYLAFVLDFEGLSFLYMCSAFPGSG